MHTMRRLFFDVAKAPVIAEALPVFEFFARGSTRESRQEAEYGLLDSGSVYCVSVLSPGRVEVPSLAVTPDAPVKARSGTLVFSPTCLVPVLSGPGCMAPSPAPAPLLGAPIFSAGDVT
jgi:hypothetical protein